MTTELQDGLSHINYVQYKHSISPSDCPDLLYTSLYIGKTRQSVQRVVLGCITTSFVLPHKGFTFLEAVSTSHQDRRIAPLLHHTYHPRVE